MPSIIARFLFLVLISVSSLAFASEEKSNVAECVLQEKGVPGDHVSTHGVTIKKNDLTCMEWIVFNGDRAWRETSLGWQSDAHLWDSIKEDSEVLLLASGRLSGTCPVDFLFVQAKADGAVHTWGIPGICTAKKAKILRVAGLAVINVDGKIFSITLK